MAEGQAKLTSKPESDLADRCLVSGLLERVLYLDAGTPPKHHGWLCTWWMHTCLASMWYWHSANLQAFTEMVISWRHCQCNVETDGRQSQYHPRWQNLGVLRNQSVLWQWKAYQTLNKLVIVKKVYKLDWIWIFFAHPFVLGIWIVLYWQFQLVISELDRPWGQGDVVKPQNYRSSDMGWANKEVTCTFWVIWVSGYSVQTRNLKRPW